jgi:hypothetical protein
MLATEPHTLAAQLFESGRVKTIDEAALTSPLYEEIGRLKVDTISRVDMPLAYKLKI